MALSVLCERLQQAVVKLANYTLLSMVVILNLEPSLSKQLEFSDTRRSVIDSNLKRRPKGDGKNSTHSKRPPKQAAAGPSKKLASVKSVGDFLYKFQLSVFVLYALRYALIYLISLDLFADFHYIDCFILGRFRYFGRANKVAFQILLCVQGCVLFYQYVYHNMLLPLKFYAINFLLYDYEEVLANEIQFNSLPEDENVQEERRTNAHYGDYCGYQGHDLSDNRSWRWNDLSQNFDRLLNSRQHVDDKCKANLTFCVENPFYSNRPIGGGAIKYDKWILRLNRTSQSWMKLKRFAVLTFSGLPLIVYGYYCILSNSVAGSIWSNMGFELSYPTCVDWIQKSQRQYLNTNLTTPGTTLLLTFETDYTKVPDSSIYLAPEVVADQLHMDNVPFNIPMDDAKTVQLNLYAWIRITADIVVNIYWYLAYIIVVCVQYNQIILCDIDLIINALEIKAQLNTLIKKLRDLKHETSFNSRFGQKLVAEEQLNESRQKSADLRPQKTLVMVNYKILDLAGGNKESEISETRARLLIEITNIQALLVDHFSMVHAYNKVQVFSSFNLSLFFFFFFGYSFILGTFTSTSGSEAVKHELIITQIGLTFFAIVYFTLSSIVRTLNYRLYTQVTIAMALDQHPDSKLRWPKIMGYYKGMFCFTRFGSAQVSWAFLDKMVGLYYILVAILVSFHYVRHQSCALYLS